MKRKHSIDTFSPNKRTKTVDKKYKCRFKGCINTSIKISEIFCDYHRGYIDNVQNASDIFHSTENKMIIDDDIIIQILMYNLPHRDIINQKIDSYSLSMRSKNVNIKPVNNKLTLLTKTEVQNINKYINSISLISKTVKNIFDDIIVNLYNNIFLLDTNNIAISLPKIGDFSHLEKIGLKSPSKYYMDIIDICAYIAKNNNNNEFLWNECNQDIMEYYKKKMIEIKSKNDAKKLKDKIIINLLSRTK